MKVVVAFTQDDNAPSGGAKQLYRHVDILNANGIDAVVAHPTRDFRLTWFKNDTRVVCSEDVVMEPDDFLMFGECVQDFPKLKGSERCAKVVYVQNPHNMFYGFGKNLSWIKNVYGSAAGVLCQSRYTEEQVRHFFPAANVMAFRYSFDRAPFSYCGDKKKLVTWMPRKHGGMAQAVFSLMALRRYPDGWQAAPMDGQSEEKVAETMKQAALFVSFSQNEGFGMPPAEAMACGCAVVGFTGFAGEEFMKPGLCWPTRDGDSLELGRTIEKVMNTDFSVLVETGKRASDYVRSEYSSEKEVEGVMSAWRRMTRSSVRLDGTRDRLHKEVAAYVPVYNEGPYLEALLKWLVRRVGAVFVCESEKSWCPTAEPGGKSKAVVDKVLADMPEAKGVLRYFLVKEEGAKETEPLKREAEQRNKTLAAICKEFKYVWMVEADEFYTDAEADRLWEWFFDRAESARVVRAPWHTYWRSLRWRVEPPELFKPNIIFSSDCRFSEGRKMAQEDESYAAEVPAEVCVVRHYSWSRTPSDTKKKLAAWGHAKQLTPRWFDDVFMAWKPNSGMKGLHPIEPSAYDRIVQCTLPVPEALRGHPFEAVEMIEDEPRAVAEGGKGARKRIKAVVMSHNQPESVDRLYEALSTAFDDVEVLDSGSDFDKVPVHATRSLPNVYWTGLWNEVLASCEGYDAVWVLGGDVELRADAGEYRKAMERAMPFGCWSPAVDGRSKLFMKPEPYGGKPRRVRNIEGMALAVSGELAKAIGKLPEGNRLGYGQDLWMCMRSRQAGMSNVVDGSVTVFHPEGTGYDNAEAGRQMDETFGELLGKDYRRTAFGFSDFYEENLERDRKAEEMKKFTVVTVDNGWGIDDFARIVSKMEGARGLVMRKGVLSAVGCPGVDTIPYEASLEALLKEADAALFAKVGGANREDYERILKAGVPTVVHKAYENGTIDHQKDGFVYLEDGWALKWLKQIRDDESTRRAIADSRRAKKVCGKCGGPLIGKPAGCGTCGEFPWGEKGSSSAVVVPSKDKSVSSVISVVGRSVPRVSIVTPTYRRDPKVLARCVGCSLMQTMPDWEQLVCSDGSREESAEQVVSVIGDPRVSYNFTNGKKDGDFGNTVRSEMLKKAKGDYVLFLDDDNIILPQYLERMVSALDAAPGAGFAVCRVMHFGPLHEAEGRAPKVLEGCPVKLYHVDPLQILVRREAMLKVGWDTEVGYLSDGVTLERLGSMCTHVRVEEVLGVHV